MPHPLDLAIRHSKRGHAIFGHLNVHLFDIFCICCTHPEAAQRQDA
jgi:hypothetical protein